MKKQFFLSIALLFFGLTLMISCGGGGSNSPLEGSIYIPPGGWTLQVPEEPVDNTPGVIPQRCVGPRPAPIGCSVSCKPCFFFICKDGQWTKTELHWPEGMCKPRTGNQGSSLTVCPRGPNVQCPPECSMCL